MGSINPSQPVPTDTRAPQDEQSGYSATDEKVHQIRMPPQGAGALLGSSTAAPIPDLTEEKKKKRIEVKRIKRS